MVDENGAVGGAETADQVTAEPGAQAQESQPGAPADQELQDASGAEAATVSAAAPAVEAEAKAPDAGKESGAADPIGTAGAPAAQAEQSGEQTADASTDRKDAADGQNQPGDTAQPPVAGLPDGETLVVTGPKNGRWRSGLHFGRDEHLLFPSDFVPAEGEPPYLAAERLYAILTDPALKCLIRLPDGIDQPLPPEAIAATRNAIDRLAAVQAESPPQGPAAPARKASAKRPRRRR